MGRITELKWPCLSKGEMLRQSKKVLFYPVIIMLAWINESGFVSKILYVATAFSKTIKSTGKSQSS